MSSKKSILVRWIAAGCLLLSVTLGNTARGDERVTSDRRLPKETYVYVSISNAPEFGRQLSKTSIGQLLRDKALVDFWKEAQEKLAEKQKDFEKVLGAQLTELPQIAQGEVSLAICKSDSNGMALVAFLHHGEKPELLDKLLEKAEKALAEKGVKRSEQEISDTKVVTYKKASAEGEKDKPKDDDDDAPAKKDSQPELSYFQKDGLLVVGTELDVLKQVLGRWDGQHEETLGKQEVFRYIVDHCRGEQQTEPSAFVWYVDPVGAFSALSTSKQSNPQLMMAAGFVPALGLNKFRGWGGAIDFPGSEFDIVSRSILYLDQPPTALINLFQFQAEAQAPPKWVRSDVAGYAAFNWDLKKGLAGLESVVDGIRGPNTVSKFFDKLAEEPDGPKVHPRKDFLDHFTGHFHLITHAPQGTDVKALENRLVVAFELTDPGAVKATITKIVALGGPKVKTREFGGETLYEISGLPGGKGETPATPGLVVAEGHLMFSTDITLLEQVLRSNSNQEPLAEAAAYKSISRKFPEKTTGINYSRQDAQIRAIYEMARSGVLKSELQKKTGIDFSKLPDFAVLQKYFTPSGGYSIPDEHGLKSISFSLPASAEEK